MASNATQEKILTGLLRHEQHLKQVWQDAVDREYSAKHVEALYQNYEIAHAKYVELFNQLYPVEE